MVIDNGLRGIDAFDVIVMVFNFPIVIPDIIIAANVIVTYVELSELLELI